MDAPGPRVWPGCDLTGFFLGGNPAFQVVGQLLPMVCEPAFLVEGLSLVGINLHQLSPLRGGELFSTEGISSPSSSPSRWSESALVNGGSHPFSLETSSLPAQGTSPPLPRLLLLVMEWKQ